MKKLHFEIQIQAKPERVWDAIVNDREYREWTSAFHEGSYFEGGWQKGDAIRFVAINERGKKDGMVSEIAESRYPSFISIRHLGIISDGIEDRTSEAVRKWAPSFENYTFRSEDGGTRFEVDMDSDEEFAEMFSEMWPRALQKLKSVAESPR